MSRHYWPHQQIWLRHFAPDEFDRPELMSADYLLDLDELRERCGFPIQVNDDGRTDGDMEALYGPDRSKWPDSAHWAREGRPALATDLQPAGHLTPLEWHRRRMVMMYHTLEMWMEGRWPRLGLELATAHVHLDESLTGLRPMAFPGVSK